VYLSSELLARRAYIREQNKRTGRPERYTVSKEQIDVASLNDKNDPPDKESNESEEEENNINKTFKTEDKPTIITSQTIRNNVIESRDLLFLRKDNIAYFVDTYDKPLDSGSQKLFV